MRKKLVFLNLLVVLTLMVSGCLPSIPKEIHGPTWTCNYRFPLIKEKQISVKEALKEGIDHGLTSPGTFRVAGAEPATVEDNSSSSFERVNIFYTIKNDSPIDPRLILILKSVSRRIPWIKRTMPTRLKQT